MQLTREGDELSDKVGLQEQRLTRGGLHQRRVDLARGVWWLGRLLSAGPRPIFSIPAVQKLEGS